jgi:hypothetical protein
MHITRGRLRAGLGGRASITSLGGQNSASADEFQEGQHTFEDQELHDDSGPPLAGIASVGGAIVVLPIKKAR